MASIAKGSARTPREESFEFLDRHGAGGDARFAVDGAAVFERGDQMHVRERGRKDASANGQHFAADADGFGEIAGDMRERGQKKIAEIVADETASRMKTILEETARRASSFERATMQLRMSPGGRMRFSRRKRPELPPSSVTVTMAARSAMGARCWRVHRCGG